MLEPSSILAGISLVIATNLLPAETPAQTLCAPNQSCQQAESDYSQTHELLSAYSSIPTLSTSKSTAYGVAAAPKGYVPPKLPLRMAAASFEKNSEQSATTQVSLPHLDASSSDPHPLSSDRLFELVNLTRSAYGHQPLATDGYLCQIADERLPELKDEIFGPKAMHSGFKARQFPIRITENLIHQRTEEKAVSWWLNSSIHRSALLSGTHTHGCVRCIGNSCVMLYTSFAAKP